MPLMSAIAHSNMASEKLVGIQSLGRETYLCGKTRRSTLATLPPAGAGAGGRLQVQLAIADRPAAAAPRSSFPVVPDPRDRCPQVQGQLGLSQGSAGLSGWCSSHPPSAVERFEVHVRMDNIGRIGAALGLVASSLLCASSGGRKVAAPRSTLNLEYPAAPDLKTIGYTGRVPWFSWRLEVCAARSGPQPATEIPDFRSLGSNLGSLSRRVAGFLEYLA